MIHPILAAEALQTPTDDTTLVERIRAKLALVVSDPRSIEIKVKNGIVTLAGQLRDSPQSRAAALMAHRVDGVTNVVNKLSIGWGWSLVSNGAPSRPAARRPKTSKRTNGSSPSSDGVNAAE